MSQNPSNFSTDRVYASGNESAVENYGNLGNRDPVRKPSAVYDNNDPSTDKIYRDGGSDRGRAAVAQQQQQQQPPAVTDVPVTSDADVATAADRVIATFAAGADRVVVAMDDPAYERRVRTSLELAVARKQITPEHYRDVTFTRRIGNNDAILQTMIAPPAKTDDDLGLDLGDPEAFVRGNTAVGNKTSDGIHHVQGGSAVVIDNNTARDNSTSGISVNDLAAASDAAPDDLG